MGVQEPILSEAEQEAIAALAANTPNLAAEWHTIIREIARSEIASLAALVLRRTQESNPTRSFERNAAEDAVNAKLASIFGEALSDFSGHTGSGDKPGT